MIDIGVNLSSKRFKDDIGDVLERALEAGVEKLVLTGTSVDESQAVLKICQEYAGQFPSMLYATCGIHPHDAKSFNHSSLSSLRELVGEPSLRGGLGEPLGEEQHHRLHDIPAQHPPHERDGRLLDASDRGALLGGP